MTTTRAREQSADAAAGQRRCGTVSGYSGGCRCSPCSTAWADWHRRRRRERAYGRWQPLTDAGPARDHVRELRESGLSLSQIAAMAGVRVGVLRCLLHPDPRSGATSARIRPAHADAILAVQPGQRPPSGLVPAAGTTRRLQALAVLGWTMADLAKAAGDCSTQALSRVAAGGRSHVAAETAASATRVYDQLWDKPGPSQVSRSRAAAKGWPPALAWDEDDSPHGIDNPAAVPHPWQPSASAAGGPGRRAADVAEDAGELFTQGHNLAQAAWRLGMKPTSLERALYRHRARARGERAA